MTDDSRMNNQNEYVADTSDNSEYSEMLRVLSGVEGISIENGLEFCGSAPAFFKFLTRFYNSIDSKAKEIEDAYNIEDYDFYTIKVHALKSTSRIIGANELSDLALSLEEAGEDKNLDFITDNTDRLLQMFRSYKERLAFLDKGKEPEDTRKEISSEDLKEAYDALKEIVPTMDYDAVEMIIEGIKKYRLPKEEEARIERIEELLKNVEWDQMEELVLSFHAPEEEA